MNTEIIVHGVLAVAIGIGGCWRVKKGDREGALFLAGAQPSIAIALSLFDLGTTFGDMQNALVGGGIFEALSLKMFHMTGGIVAGLAQEGITQFYLPIKAEEERSRESIKDAVVEGIASQMQEMNEQVRRVGQIIESVPNDIDVIVKQSTDNIKYESVKVADLVQSSFIEHGKQATETFRKDAQSIQQDLTSHSNAVSSSVKEQSAALLKYAEDIQKYSQDTQQNLTLHSNAVSASAKQANEAFHKDAQSIKQDLTSHSNAVSSSVKQATESAAKQAIETFNNDAQSIRYDLTSHSNAVSSSMKQQSEALHEYAQNIQKYSQDTQQNLTSHSNAVSSSVKQATETFHKDVQSIQQDLTSHSNAVSSSVKQATESAADIISSRIKQEMEQTMTEAARQGGDVILSMATQVTKTLQSTTSNSMMATANLAKTSEEALQRIADLVPR